MKIVSPAVHVICFPRTSKGTNSSSICPSRSEIYPIFLTSFLPWILNIQMLIISMNYEGSLSLFYLDLSDLSSKHRCVYHSVL